MERADRLQFCRTCVKRGFNPEKGVVCSLTGEYADFDGECSDYELDNRVLRAEMEKKRRELEEALQNNTGGLASFGIKNGIAAGIILLTLGFGWFIGGLFADTIFFYPFILIIAGLVALGKGITTEKKKAAAKRKFEQGKDLLDR